MKSERLGATAPPDDRSSKAVRPTSLEVTNLRKTYGSRLALDGVTVSFGVGLTGLLGPNGAGKSTFIRSVAGIQNWDEGSIQIDGQALGRRGRQAIGYMPETVAFPRELRVGSYLRFVCDAKGVGRSWRSEVDQVLGATGLAEMGDRVIGSLSKGYRQRLGLAQAMVGHPPVLLLDEPVSSLDPINLVEVRDAIRDYARSACVLLSTHQLAEATALCERVVVLDRGRLAFDGPMSELGRGSHGRFEVEVLAGDESTVVAAAAGEAAVRQVRPGAFLLTASPSSDAVLARLVTGLVNAGCGVISVRPVGDALEEAFAHAVAHAVPETTS